TFDIGEPQPIRYVAIPFSLDTVANGTFRVAIKMPFGGVIDQVTSICDSGTATATVKINTTALGGTANAVSSTEQNQAQASANVVAIGDYLNVTISANSACLGLALMIR